MPDDDQLVSAACAQCSTVAGDAAVAPPYDATLGLYIHGLSYMCMCMHARTSHISYMHTRSCTGAVRV